MKSTRTILLLFCLLVTLPLMAQESGPRFSRARVMHQSAKATAITNAKKRSRHTVGLMNMLTRDTVGANTLHHLDVTGKGVVLCVVDQGIDFNHQAFTDSTGVCHVKRAMIYPAEFGDSIWNDDHTEWHWNYVYAQTPEEIARLTTDYKDGSHGTHTSTSAGGARRKVSKQDAEYYGMAPDADLFLVGNPTLEAEYTLDAFNHAREYARSVGKPLVCSYSIGDTFEPIDTLEYWPQALRKFTEDGNAKGLAVCVTAGNSGSPTDKLSLHWDFSDADAPLVHKTVLGHSMLEGGKIFYNMSYAMFYDVLDRDLEYQLSIMDANKDTVVWQSDLISTTVETECDIMEGTSFQKYGKVHLSSGVDQDNHWKCAYIQCGEFYLPYHESDSPLPADTCYVLTITVRGERGGFIEGKSYPGSQYGVGFSAGTKYMSGYEEGDAVSALNAYCANPWCISVGASDATESGGGYASFSGYGYDFYGNPYPEVLAPGVNVISAISRYEKNPTSLTVHPFGVMSGTSMSTPITAGLIACWMQENPELTTNQIHDIIARTSYIDPALAATAPDPSKYGRGTIQGKTGWDMVRDLKPTALIEAVSRLQSDAATYNLQGVKVNGGKGIIIRDNRLVIIE